jgi:hypothetical protein
MSLQYDMYLADHKANVAKAYDWLYENLFELVQTVSSHNTHYSHDESKYSEEEYNAYDAYFYGNNQSFEVMNNFRKAWLHHIHHNPHHWQHWVLINDEPNEGTIALEMPYVYVIEMICDWWAFSHKSGNLYEIFDWYDKHKDRMILNANTRKTVETILSQIKNKLDSKN